MCAYHKQNCKKYLNYTVDIICERMSECVKVCVCAVKNLIDIFKIRVDFIILIAFRNLSVLLPDFSINGRQINLKCIQIDYCLV